MACQRIAEQYYFDIQLLTVSASQSVFYLLRSRRSRSWADCIQATHVHAEQFGFVFSFRRSKVCCQASGVHRSVAVADSEIQMSACCSLPTFQPLALVFLHSAANAVQRSPLNKSIHVYMDSQHAPLHHTPVRKN